MISYEEARRAVLDNVHKRDHGRRVAVVKAAGLFLAEDVRAPFALPRFDCSAVDGYALRVADIVSDGRGIAEVPCDGVSAAGREPPELLPGAAMRIYTGAPVPRGADAVIMQEDVEKADTPPLGMRIRPDRLPRAGENIRRTGEEFPKGALLLQAGTRITPPAVGLLSSAGYRKCNVIQPPVVRLLLTGDELVSTGRARLAPGQIYDSNATALLSALSAAGLRKISHRNVRDRAKTVARAIDAALRRADLVLISGGVSVGDRDFVRGALLRLGVREIFWRIAVKPGKPLYFGIGLGGQVVFGLPGNPVSVLVTYHEFVLPAILKMMGSTSPVSPSGSAILRARIRKKSGRLDLVRGRLAEENGSLFVEAAAGQDSHMLGALALADVLIVCPSERESIEAGETVEIRYLRWGI